MSVRRAVVFAGQGAQAVGMGKDLAEAYPECRRLYEMADNALGYSLSGVCFSGPIEELTRSVHCQPAIFVTSLACLAALRRSVPGVAFHAAAGLSLGEWTALHEAGVLTFEDALRVLAARGRFMQEACEEQPGGMLSVMGLSEAVLEAVCRQAGVFVANFNGGGQMVLSGPKAGIVEADRLAREAGAKRTVTLQVAGAFHSPLMASAARRLDAMLAGIAFQKPVIPVPANVTGLPHGEPDAIRKAMVEQVTGSVRWQACIEWMRSDGVGAYVECGPGRVLSGLIKRIDSEAVLHNIDGVPALEKTAAGLSVAVAE